MSVDDELREPVGVRAQPWQVSRLSGDGATVPVIQVPEMGSWHVLAERALSESL